MTRGDAAEALAAAFLEARGLKVVARNFRCRAGEIDLIALSGPTTVFVEVRARTSDRFGGAAASVTAAKRKRLLKTARYYLAQQGGQRACRFDVVLLSGAARDIEWIQDAFGE